MSDVGMITTADVGDKVVKGVSVADIGASLQQFGWQDYAVFSFMLLVSVAVGVYFCFFKSSSSATDYLMGGRKMTTFPVGVSLMATFFSGISLLGIPTEIYVYGIQYIYIIAGILLMGLVFERVFLPVFHQLDITSVYEYLEMRFDKKTRLLASVLFTVSMLTWLPIVIYVPALAFNQVTGINIHITAPVVFAICIVYTCIGGLKAVVWTDVIQTVIMIGAMILVVSKGTADVGGPANVWNRNWDSGRIEGPNVSFNPLTRHTLWSLMIGGLMYWLQEGALNQNMVQRFLSLPDFASARRALWIYISGIILVQSLCSYAGLLIYATYYKCDPLTTTLAKEKDQLLPLLMMDVIGNIPGLPGLFVAGVFSAALSSLSTGLNSMSAIVLEDFYKSCFVKPLSERSSQMLMKATVVVFGAICMCFVFVVEKLGTVLQLTMSFVGIANGASLGLFCMGALLPWTTGTSAFSGGLCSLAFMAWLCLKAQVAILSGDISFPEKQVSTEGCNYHFTPKQSPYMKLHLDTSSHHANITHTDETVMIYGLSYLWYTFVGTVIATTVGVLVSLVFHRNDPRDVNPTLLAPFVRKLIKPREFPNQPSGNEIIYAYERRVNIRVAKDDNVALEEINGPQSA